MSEVFEYLNGTTFYVATVDSNKPRVCPFGFVMELKSKLYFGTKDKNALNTTEGWRWNITNWVFFLNLSRIR